MLIFKKRSTKGSEEQKKSGAFSQLRVGLKKTREAIFSGMSDFVLGEKAIDENVIEEIENHLLLADIGAEVTQEIIVELTAKIRRKELGNMEAVINSLKQHLCSVLTPWSQPLAIGEQQPFVILMVGVNGSGKTTTMGKLAQQLQTMGKKVMFAAGDTFRAAAIEQLQIWGQRIDVPVIAQHAGADSASVIYDALQAAKARNYDVLIADTAGRLHTQSHLMEELKKIKRVVAKIDPSAPHEVLLVLDAGVGQNALVQAKQFHAAVGVTGIVLTKLDGTAKGGIIFAIARSLGVPIRFIGVGESSADLQYFVAEKFVEALF